MISARKISLTPCVVASLAGWVLAAVLVDLLNGLLGASLVCTAVGVATLMGILEGLSLVGTTTGGHCTDDGL